MVLNYPVTIDENFIDRMQFYDVFQRFFFTCYQRGFQVKTWMFLLIHVGNSKTEKNG